MTRQEYNESKGIIKMLDAGDLTVECDEEWVEFIDLILPVIKNKAEVDE